MMMMHFYGAFSRFICSNTLRNTLRRKVSPDCVELLTILGKKFAGALDVLNVVFENNVTP